MISNETFVLILGMLLAGLVSWAFKRLPDERWQFLASVPILKDANGHWRGLNFTYYGTADRQCPELRRGFTDRSFWLSAHHDLGDSGGNLGGATGLLASRQVGGALGRR